MLTTDTTDYSKFYFRNQPGKSVVYSALKNTLSTIRKKIKTNHNPLRYLIFTPDVVLIIESFVLMDKYLQQTIEYMYLCRKLAKESRYFLYTEVWFNVDFLSCLTSEDHIKTSEVVNLVDRHITCCYSSRDLEAYKEIYILARTRRRLFLSAIVDRKDSITLSSLYQFLLYNTKRNRWQEAEEFAMQDIPRSSDYQELVTNLLRPYRDTTRI
jgi:hypothetical protein